MKKFLSYIVIISAVIAVIVLLISNLQKSRTIVKLENSITIKTDSIKMLLDKYNALKTAYKFDYIGAKAILQNSSIQTKDTLKAMSFLFAAGLVSESDVTTSIVYQIIPESYYHGLYNPDSDSLWTYDNFFSNKLPIDSGEYKNEEFYINYIPKKPGKYYLRGYFNVPSIGYKNKLYISKYPFQSVFEAH